MGKDFYNFKQKLANLLILRYNLDKRREIMLNVCDKRFLGKDDSETIQNAVNAAKNDNDRIVVIPRFNERTGEPLWVISRAILLPNNVTIYLSDCHIVLADGVFDNIFRNENAYTEAGVSPFGEQYGIKIIGMGNAVLDGGKDNGLREQLWTPDKPNPRTGCLILLVNVRDYEIKDFACVQMRYWAINQICCRKGYISNLHFDAKIRHPNQDGINFRIGCNQITVENITGYTGDDTIALTALPFWDAELLVKGRSPDIHDITIRNVRSSTNCTVVALRNTDGAKLYNITIENITGVDDGTHKPWGTLRIGENNWYKNRPAELGEIDRLTISNIRSEVNGCIFLSAALSNSTITNVFAYGKSVYAISTYQSVQKFWETNCDIKPGVSMKNVVISKVFYSGSAEYKDNLEDRYMELTFPGEPFSGCAIDFRCLRQTDTLNNVAIKDVFVNDDREKLLLKEGYCLSIK